MGIGENEEVQLFYYFVESERNPDEDPIIFYIPGGPGVSGLPSLAFGREGRYVFPSISWNLIRATLWGFILGINKLQQFINFILLISVLW